MGVVSQMKMRDTVFEKLMAYSAKPTLYSGGTIKLWEDAHISQGMLQAHISPNIDAGSRNHSFIDRSVEWISDIAPVTEYPRVLDLGCGPGLYATRLYNKGYQVTGIDISENSIRYARETAEKEDAKITYIHGSYLELDEIEAFDLAILIYCDYSVLSPEERQKLLKNIMKALRKGGKLIFDVFTPLQYEGRNETTRWYFNDSAGFFKASPHLCLESTFIYEDDVRLDQYVILDENDQVDVIRVWDRSFTKERLLSETESEGFVLEGSYENVAGDPYNEASKSLCFVMRK